MSIKFKYIKILVVMAVMLFAYQKSIAQTEPMYSQYMFNMLGVNPAYAGSREATSFNLFQRRQWIGLQGAPQTTSFSLDQSILDKTAQNFIFIRYEDLCTNPKPQLDSIYKFFGMEPFEHDFKHIPQITVEDDTVHGIYGDHTIRNTLGMLPDDSKEVLGEHTSNWIYNQYRWYYDIFGYIK